MRYRWVVLDGCVLAYATSHLTRCSYTGFAAYISADLHLDKAALGLLGAAFFYP
jgi:sugar phosphate permease